MQLVPVQKVLIALSSMLPEPSKPIVVVVLSDALRITMQSVTLPFNRRVEYAASAPLPYVSFSKPVNAGAAVTSSHV